MSSLGEVKRQFAVTGGGGGARDHPVTDDPLFRGTRVQPVIARAERGGQQLDVIAFFARGIQDFPAPIEELRRELFVIQLRHGESLSGKDGAGKVSKSLDGQLIASSNQTKTTGVWSSMVSPSAVQNRRWPSRHSSSDSSPSPSASANLHGTSMNGVVSTSTTTTV